MYIICLISRKSTCPCCIMWWLIWTKLVSKIKKTFTLTVISSRVYPFHKKRELAWCAIWFCRHYDIYDDFHPSRSKKKSINITIDNICIFRNLISTWYKLTESDLLGIWKEHRSGNWSPRIAFFILIDAPLGISTPLQLPSFTHCKANIGTCQFPTRSVGIRWRVVFSPPVTCRASASQLHGGVEDWGTEVVISIHVQFHLKTFLLYHIACMKITHVIG